MRTPYTPSPGATLALVLLFLGFVISLAANLPGHLSYDSVIQLLEGRNAAYAGWHPPVMSWLLGLGDAVLPGTSLFVLFDALLFFASLFALVSLFPRAPWLSAVVAALIVASPQALIYQGAVWKDVLFADAAIAGFVLLVHAAAHWHTGKLRHGLIAAGFLSLSLASLARQNGIIALVTGSIALAAIAIRLGSDWRMGLLQGGTALAAAILFLTAANVALGTRIVAPSGPLRQFHLLQLYDVVGAMAAQPGTDFGGLSSSAPRLSIAIRTDGVRLFTPQRNDPLASSAPLQAAFNAAPSDSLSRAWYDLIFRHTWRYLRVRWQDFRWVFLTPDVKLCLPYYVGVSGPAGEMDELGLEERWDGRDEALDRYAKAFVGTPVFSHPFFAVLGLGAFVLLIRRRKPADLAMAALLACAFLYTLSFFFISIACDYRYLYFLDAAALVGLLHLALDPPNLALLRRNRMSDGVEGRQKEGEAS